MTQQSGGTVGRGIVLMVIAISLFTFMGAFIKAAARVPAGEAMFFRAGFALPVILLWVRWRGGWRDGLRTSSIRPHAVRAIAGTLAMGLGFAGLRYLPLPEVTALRFTTPMIVVLLGALMLGERLRLVRLSAVGLGLIGVVVITLPRLSAGPGSAEALGAGIILGSAALAALAQIFVKSMSGKETTTAIVFWFSLTATLLSLLTVPFGWVWPTSEEAALLIGAGLIGGVGQLVLTSSYRFAEAGVLAPFTYVSMLWSLVLGYLWFDEVPGAMMLLGAGLIIAAGALIVWRERQLGLRATAERKVQAKQFQ